ncbi:MAG: ribosome biogenesis GTPase Der [Anaerolineae bacterium]|nr:ribosome biogenesis GTPase Der [Anaerolineae bacterium]NUQ05325.1 ribosome biogenesis GTPase Der [Anaerolineae bacterium]
MARKPLVALVGRPNVGKSTLFNRLVGERLAVTNPIPGTTRDRLGGVFDWHGMLFDVVDTGGIEVYQPKGTRDEAPLAEGSFEFVPQIKAQALIAVQDADIIVLVVDGTTGITAADEEIAEILRRTQKPVLIAANKADHVDHFKTAVEFYGLGLGEVYPLSAIHGLGVGDLLDGVIAAARESLPELVTMPGEGEEEDQHLKIAIVGRPNVGKSSLTNRLIGAERMIVSPVSGTTRDAIDSEITFHGEPITLIDTAGIRRRGKIEPGVEKYSVLRAMKAIDRCDVALLLIDAIEGITDQDAHIAGYVMEAGKSIVLIVNKWDAVEKDNSTHTAFQQALRERFDFLPDPPMIFISALTGQRIHQVLETAHQVYEGRFTRVPTAEVNRLLRAAMQRHPPPARGTVQLKIYYGSQVRVAPPLFLFHVNDPAMVHFTYRRYLENQLRAEYPFTGTPIRMSFRPRDKDED